MSLHDVVVPEDGSIVRVEGLELHNATVTALFGPNGAGKTTVLRALAGMGGAPMLDCSYLPQTPYLFRGLAGYNLGLGLDVEEASLAGQYARRLGLEQVLGGPAATLSGGQRQRLALARALAKQAEWVLLDEPLGAIDLADRNLVLRVVGDALDGRSAVVVTHDLGVAATLARSLAVVDGGRLLQQGEIGEVLRSPASLEVARVLGVANLVHGVAKMVGEGIVAVVDGDFEVRGSGDLEGEARAVFPAEAVVLSISDTGRSSAQNRWAGTVRRVSELGPLVEVLVDAGSPVVALVTRGSAEEMDLAEGRAVVASVKASAVTVVPV